MKTLSAGEANRHFSSVLREVARGEVVTVLSRGKPVATIAAVRPGDRERSAARRDLLARLRAQPASGNRDWTREMLYDS